MYGRKNLCCIVQEQGDLAGADVEALSRNLMQVYDMLHSVTNCSFMELVSLMDYGNWCGPGDNGKSPLDSLDACCQVNSVAAVVLLFRIAQTVP